MHEHYVIRAGRNGVVLSGTTVQTVRLNVEGYFKRFFSLPSSQVQELVAIAAGIYAVDRISKRRMGPPYGGVRQLRLSFQVHNIRFWSSNEVRHALLEVISFLTDDDWQIDFEKLLDPSDARRQDYLDLQPKPAVERIALYSGGLDSAAGLAHQIFVKGVRDYLLVTVGHYSGLHSRVKQQLAALTTILTDTGHHHSPSILHSTLTTSLEGGKAVRMRDREGSQRSRALFFCASAVSAADVFGLSNVDIFENGVGAINLPVMTGMLGRGLATRGAHPTFLAKMSALASLVMQRQLNFVLPFQHFTKGEILQSIATVPGIGGWLQKSSSCIHTSLRVTGVTHCGECPGCIERRQAFMTADMPVKLEDYQIDVATISPSDPANKEYFYLYRLDAMKWQGLRPESLRRMDYHLAITSVPQDARQDIVNLQLRNSREIMRGFGPPFFDHFEASVESSNALLNTEESP